jgi:DNA-binding CsgD family transcriptional regulator
MATAVMTRWPFVGRRRELESFVDALEGRHCDAVIVTGISGVGKSRLAEECLDYAQAKGYPVAYVRATESSSAVPLSALAPLLPDHVDLTEPHALFAAVRRQVRERGHGSRLILGIDDVDLLDPSSRALVAFLLADNAIFVVATQRLGAVPDTLQARQRDGRALQISLNSLDRTTVETLLHVALGGPMTAAVAQALWTASQGNVLYLRELVLRAQADGALTEIDGVWRLSGSLTGSVGVVELVSARLRDLTPGQRSVMELLALCEPISVDELLAHTPLEVLTELEQHGLITLHDRGRRQEITLSHPLHAQVLQEALPKLRSRSILLAQALRVEQYGARRRGDPLIIASWRLDATGTADPDLLLRAATLARHNHDVVRVRKLAAAALRHGQPTEAGALLADALAELGLFAEAESAYADFAPHRPERALNLHFGLNDPGAARRCLQAADAADPETIAVTALLSGASGSTRMSVTILEQQAPVAGRRAVWLRVQSEVLLGTGRLAQATVTARAAYDEHAKTNDRAGLPHPARYLSTMADAMLEQGRFDEAQRLAQEAHASAVADEAVSALPWPTWILGRVELARGRPATADRWFRESLAAADAYPMASISGSAQAGLALAAAWRDRAWTEPLLPGPADAEFVTAHADLVRAVAWNLARDGRLSEAIGLLLSAADARAGDDRRTDTVTLLHDALRLGGRAAAGPLTQLAPQVDGELSEARGAHAAATERRDARALQTAAERFEALGANLCAAEVFVVAAGMLRADGTSRAANALQTRAATLVERCEGASTPALRADTGSAPLSPREREVAVLAARGVSSKEIARQLALSVRTVDNHLQSIYAKLGVAGRMELAAAYIGPGRAGGSR